MAVEIGLNKVLQVIGLLASKPLLAAIDAAACSWETLRAVQGLGGFLWADRSGRGLVVRVEKKQL